MTHLQLMTAIRLGLALIASPQGYPTSRQETSSMVICTSFDARNGPVLMFDYVTQVV